MKGIKLYRDRYALLGEVASGGFATIYRAAEQGRDDEVAIKVGKVPTTADPAYAKSLRQEARVLQRFDHNNIVQLYPIRRYDRESVIWYANAVELPGAPVFFVMEYLSGGSLEAYMNQVGRVTPAEAAAIALEVARALHHMHQHGYTHNDLKLENIVFRHPVEAGKPFAPVMVDFGIATRIQSPDAGSLYVMAPEMVDEMQMKTPPELARTERAKADVWGVGIVLYRMLGGQLPFSGRNERTLTQRIRSSRPTSLRQLSNDVPPEVDELIIDGCLAKKPEHRLSLPELGRWLGDMVGDGVEAQRSAGNSQGPGLLSKWFGRG